MKVNRRNFIKAAGSLVLASVTQTWHAVSAPRQAPKPQRPRVAVFFEPNFPTVDGLPIEREKLLEALGGFDVALLSASDLRARLRIEEHDLLITPYGSTFPKEAWAALFQYLRSGGNWVNLGGIPLSIPVNRGKDGWKREVGQTQYQKRLGITQAFPISGKKIASYRTIDSVESGASLLKEFVAEEIYELYVRFTISKDFPDEDGSAGPRDATLQPLVFGLSEDNRPIAAPFLQIDRLQGDYAGGRWILANFNGSITPRAVRVLADSALQGSMEFNVRSSFACYQEVEVPSVTIQLRRPKGDLEKLIKGASRVEILDEKKRTIETMEVKLSGVGSVATGQVTLSSKKALLLKPGIYAVSARLNLQSISSNSEYTVSHTNGFWIFDKKLLESGKPFTADSNYLLTDGKPYPVTGTTYMGSDVHRKFLFEPNPFLWNKDFSEMQAAGINMVRTGIWTGWRNYMLDVGAPNEVALRAMDAFVLTARKYDIPLIFTFFAFLPEQWGGQNAYLDPRSVNAQKEFASVFAQRYRGVNDIIWDFINEPSFCSPQHLWSCRPNNDKYEIEAWNEWLKERYAAASEDERNARLQELYRTAADESISLPSLDDFSNVNIFDERRPVKVIDYRLFAQEMFTRWVKRMTEAVRSNGNPHQLVTVGQDEAGTYDSPCPQFFSEAVDFSCLHNWWLNDDLLWDSVMTKAPGKPNLVEETGVMYYENIDGSARRTEEEVRNLLERKLAISIGGGGAGFIEWIWNTNPFMKSDNEAAIGLFRVDGTAKPELQPVIDYARFFAVNRRLMTGKQDEEVVMVIPHSQMFSVRNYATEATKRCVRAMSSHCGTAIRAVSEYGLDSLKAAPNLLLVPSPRTLCEKAWAALMKYVEVGSTVLITGPFNLDDHWLPVMRARQLGIEATTRPVAQEEFLVIDGKEYQLSYRGDKIQRIEKAVVEKEQTSAVKILPRGKGMIIWAMLPVELAEPIDSTAALYKVALREAKCSSIFSLEEENPSILILPLLFEHAAMYTVVSECDRDTNVRITHLETDTPLELTVSAQRSTVLFLSRKDGRVLSRLG